MSIGPRVPRQRTSSRAPQQPPASVDSVEDLGCHLVHDHHRSPAEMGTVSLQAIHRLEHFDHELGLLALDHSHAH